jgi:DNA polymerase I-like protein with 3'-5' exonuclease and polymerase domains
MADVINAGIDPHRWFAGVMNKIITADLTHKDDPEWVAKTNTFLEAHVTKKQRQDAKAANFGLPGGMQPKRFYQHCRSMGIEITMQQAEEMCSAWENTFTEMRYHKIALKSKRANIPLDTYGMARQNDGEDDDDSEDPKDKKKHAYMSILKCGQMRDRCSFNSSLNYQFQALTALGAKLAGWNLVYNGYQDRLANFVHDEYIYWLWPNELQTHIPIIEDLMLRGMRTVITDVKVGVESSCMLHWDKKAIEFSKLQWAPDGTPILEEPPFVKQLLTEQQKGA